MKHPNGQMFRLFPAFEETHRSAPEVDMLLVGDLPPLLKARFYQESAVPLDYI